LKRSIWTAVLSLCLVVVAAPATAQERYTYTVGVLGGVGGSADSNDGGVFDGSSLQVNLGMVTNVRTHVVVRLGRIDLDGEQGIFEGLDDAQLEYVNIAGEYKFNQGYYDFGMYLGLGSYKLKGKPLPGEKEGETALGGVFGINGDFDITRHFSIIAEGSAHYAFFDDHSTIYIGAGAGVAFHF